MDDLNKKTDQTTPLPPVPPPSRARRRIFIWITVTGIALLLCSSLVVGGGFWLFQGRQQGPQVDTEIVFPTIDLKTPTVRPTTDGIDGDEIVTSAPTERPSTPTNTQAATDTPLSATNTVTVVSPSLGSICFEAITTLAERLPCNDAFPANVAEIHAIFDYSNLTPTDDQWVRVWYHNGLEVLNVVEPWNGDRDGQFDYNLNTSDGEPLSPGVWELELYVNGQLQTYGAFEVQAPVEPEDTTPAASPTPVPVTPTPPPASDYLLAFTKWDGSKHSVWVAGLDGNNQRFLLDFAASPSWSPDGSQLAFYGEEGIDTQEAVSAGTNGIWLMGDGGENPTRILPEGTGHSVAWSPTGDAIAFSAARGGTDRRVYFIDRAGNTLPFELLGEQPAWSPDGGRLVLKACRPECGLWTYNRNDTDPQQLTGGGSDGLPAWSPDGSQIAFSRNTDGNVDIYVINTDGSGLQRLTDSVGNDSVPTWTPDGRQIVFRTSRNGIWQIFIMNSDGANQRLIIDNVGASDEWAFDRMSIN